MDSFLRARAIIDLKAIAQNTVYVKKQIGEKTLCAVVKADAYGHGAKAVSSVCQKSGADYFAVAICEEGAELRQNGVICPILILGYTPDGLYGEVIENNLEQTVFSYEQAAGLSFAAAKKNKTANVHIKIDTGMNRLGFLPNEKSLNEIIKISRLKNLFIAGVYTHFAASDDADPYLTLAQQKCFDDFSARLSANGVCPKIIHAQNSGAIINYPDMPYNMARCGILLYGLAPRAFEGANALIPAMSLVSEISGVKTIKKGAGVSYGHTFHAPRKMTVATVPVGYADGYPRLLSNKASVIVNGSLAPVIGNITMDQTIIDVTGVKNAKEGDEAVLMGKRGNLEISADSLAEYADTINYEIICGIGKRIPRVYVN